MINWGNIWKIFAQRQRPIYLMNTCIGSQGGGCDECRVAYMIHFQLLNFSPLDYLKLPTELKTASQPCNTKVTWVK